MAKKKSAGATGSPAATAAAQETVIRAREATLESVKDAIMACLCMRSMTLGELIQCTGMHESVVGPLLVALRFMRRVREVPNSADPLNPRIEIVNRAADCPPPV